VHSGELYSLFSLCNSVCMINSRRIRWDSTCRMLGEMRNVYWLYLRETEIKKPTGRHRSRLADNIKMDLWETVHTWPRNDPTARRGFCEQGDVHIGPKKASCVSTTLLACGFHVLSRNSKPRSVLQGKCKHPSNSKWQYPVPGRCEAMHSRDWGQWSHVSWG